MSELVIAEKADLVAIADALREKTGVNDNFTFPAGFIEAIEAGGDGVALPELSNPATSSDILLDKEAIDAEGNKITGNIATKTSSDLTASGATVSVPVGYYASAASKSVSTATQATPSISVSSAGLITASATQSAGYVSSGTKSATKQLTTQAAKTVTPTTSEQTAVASGVYTTGAVTVAGDANLVAENIAEGVSIFGVTGTMTSGGSGGGFPNGTEWTQSNITSGEILCLSYGNGVFVSCNNDDKTMIYSYDGKVWLTSNLTNITYVTDICFGKGIFVMSCESTGSGTYWSVDGISWTKSTSTIFNSIEYGQGIFVAISDFTLYYSTTGKTWTTATFTSSSNKPSAGSLQGLCYGDGIWVCSHYTYQASATIQGKGLYYSEDGKNWSKGSGISTGVFTPSYANGMWIATAWGDGYMVLNGHGILYSTDGKSWTSTNVTEGWGFTNACYTGKKWITTQYMNGLWESTDGITWTQVLFTDDIGIGVDFFTNLIYDSSILIGYYYGFGVMIYSLDEGETWKDPKLPDSIEYFDTMSLIHANNIWIVGTYENGLLYSVTWEPTT